MSRTMAVDLGTARTDDDTVVGSGSSPRNMNGTYGPAADNARTFAENLRARVGCPVGLWDERLTTVAAQRALRESGRKARDQRGVVDQVAAQILLQSWLDRAPCDLS